MYLVPKVNVGHDLRCQEQLCYVVGNWRVIVYTQCAINVLCYLLQPTGCKTKLHVFKQVDSDKKNDLLRYYKYVSKISSYAA